MKFSCPEKERGLFQTRLCPKKQEITQGRSDSAGQMSGKTIKSVYKRYTLGPDKDKVPRPGTESLAELCCTECYFKVLFPAVEVSKVGSLVGILILQVDSLVELNLLTACVL